MRRAVDVVRAKGDIVAWQRGLPLLLVVLGVGAIGAAFAADAVGVGGKAGFGGKQALLACGGLLALLVGGLLASPLGQRLLARPVLSPDHERPLSPLLSATFFGLASGLAEVLILTVRKLFLFEVVGLSPHVLWMAPLANVVLFGALALLLIALGRLVPRVDAPRAAVGVFAGLSALSLALLFPQLERPAALLLAVGVGLQAARLAAAHPRGCSALVCVTTGWLAYLPRPGRRPPPEPAPPAPRPSRRQFLASSAAVLAGAALGVGGWQRLGELRATAGLPRVTRDRPNVLLVVLDTVRAPSLSLYGSQRPTSPNLARLAARGVRFERAIATAPWTLPSHASLFTGRFPHELAADLYTPLDSTYPTLAEVLGGQGYRTAAFVANTVFGNREYGLSRGFQHYEDFPVSVGQTVLSAPLGRALAGEARLRDLVGYHQALNWKPAEQVNADFLRWLPQAGERPFFAFLNYFDAHAPYIPPAPYDALFGPREPYRDMVYNPNEAQRIHRWAMTPREIQSERDAYEGGIAYVDHAVGQLVDELGRRRLLDTTLVVVVADHGEEFGEHQLHGHGRTLYLPALHVPLVLAFPSRVPAGQRLAAPVTLRDLPATVVDLLGLGTDARFPGRSLAEYWSGAEVRRDPATDPVLSVANPFIDDTYPSGMVVRTGRIGSTIQGGLHYIRYSDGHEEAYDVRQDPWEQHDLAAAPDTRQVLAQLRPSLDDVFTTG